MTVAVALAASMYAFAASGGSSAPDAATPAAAVTGDPLEALPAHARVLVRSVVEADPDADGRLYEISAGGQARKVGGLECMRVHASPSGHGLCIALGPDGFDYQGIVFGPGFRVRARFPIDGYPSRVRVARDGRYGAYTTFGAGAAQGYSSNTSDFSTNTRIVDMRTGRDLLRLKDVEVALHGKPLKAPDAELWGVTFGAAGHYYATLATKAHHYLIEGRASSDRARVVRDGVECPSLSPDGRRIAYKKRIGNSEVWRLHVLDLDGHGDVALAETRSIDDQPEWLGDDLIAYSDRRTTFTVPADGRGSPRRVAGPASSPALVVADD